MNNFIFKISLRFKGAQSQIVDQSKLLMWAYHS